MKTNKKSCAKSAAAKPACTKTACCKKPAEKKACAKKAALTAVTFTLRADKGKQVYVAGSFNAWDPAGKKMTFKNGVYSATLKLAAGRYEYKYVVDGLWMADPECADFVGNACGTLNSVINVK